MQLIINPGESLTAVMSGAAATTNPTVLVTDSPHSPRTKAVALNGNTAVTLANDTNASQQVTGLSIYNIDTAAVTLTIKQTIAGTAYTLYNFTLQVGDTWYYDERTGPYVIDTSGQLKQTATSTSVQPFAIPLSLFKKTDGITDTPASAATTNFGFVMGTDGTDYPHLETIDSKAATTAVVGRFFCKLPENYVAGSAVTIRFRAGMKTTIADNAAATTLGIKVYSNLGIANTGSADLNTTTAQSIDSLTAANYDFVITPTGLVAGQDLHVKVTLTVTDAATGTAVIGTINHVELRTTVNQ